ncbi:MAG: glycosyltransferase [Pirellulales bacterium]|nr:glycosyltransferase [Pirellulales bacterium]
MFEEHPSDAPPIAVVIATAGRPALLERTLDSLAACTKPVHYRGVWIVENGPPGNVRQIAAKYEAQHDVRYCHVSRPNKSNALNRLLEQSDDELLVFTDDDVRFEHDALLAYETAAQDIHRGQFFGGPLGVDYESDPPPDWMRPMLPKTAVGWQRSERQIVRLPRPRFLGPNWAAFAEDLRRIGGFDPRLGPGATTGATGQETEAQQRLSADGVEGYYVPQAMAWHYVAAESMTPKWVVERKRRHSREWGIRQARQFPRWLVAAYASVRQQAARNKRRRVYLATKDEQARTHADYEVAKWQGRLEGTAMAEKWLALPEIYKRETQAQSKRNAQKHAA